MAKDLTKAHPARERRRFDEAGFSLVEMLMTAFILAVGILGLAMLQVMSLKSSRGSRSLSSAVLVGEQVMDAVEMEGRLSWLNLTDSTAATSQLTDLPSLKYVTLAAGAQLDETFNLKGGKPIPASTDPTEKNPFYSVKTTRVPFNHVATGNISDFTVEIKFTDQINQAGQPIERTVTLTRRIIHG